MTLNWSDRSHHLGAGAIVLGGRGQTGGVRRASSSQLCQPSKIIYVRMHVQRPLRQGHSLVVPGGYQSSLAHELDAWSQAEPAMGPYIHGPLRGFAIITPFAAPAPRPTSDRHVCMRRYLDGGDVSRQTW